MGTNKNGDVRRSTVCLSEMTGERCTRYSLRWSNEEGYCTIPLKKCAEGYAPHLESGNHSLYESNSIKSRVNCIIVQSGLLPTRFLGGEAMRWSPPWSIENKNNLTLKRFKLCLFRRLLCSWAVYSLTSVLLGNWPRVFRDVKEYDAVASCHNSRDWQLLYISVRQIMYVELVPGESVEVQPIEFTYRYRRIEERSRWWLMTDDDLMQCKCNISTSLALLTVGHPFWLVLTRKRLCVTFSRPFT